MILMRTRHIHGITSRIQRNIAIGVWFSNIDKERKFETKQYTQALNIMGAKRVYVTCLVTRLRGQVIISSSLSSYDIAHG